MIAQYLPTSVSSEIAFLGACLYDPDVAVDEGMSVGLKAEDFSEARHALVWKAIQYLTAKHVPIDVVTVAEVLDKSGKLQSEVSPRMLVSSLSGSAGTAIHAGAYAKTIKSKAIHRNIISAASKIAQIGYDEVDIDESLDKIDGIVRQIVDSAPKDDRTPDPLSIMKRMEQQISAGVQTRWPTINNISGGMVRGHIWIIGGFTSTGKSATIVNLMEDVAKAGKSAMVASVEMSQEQYLQRAVALTSGIGTHTLRNGGMTLEQGVQYQAAKDFWTQAKVRVFDSLYSVDRIARKAEAVKREIGLDVLFVDYLQNLSQTNDETNDVRVAVTKLQKLAKDLDCCVVALSQISNGMAQSMAEQGLGNYYAFKGTGSIAHVADLALMLERDRVKHPDIMWFHVVKNRHDESGIKFACRFDLATQRLTQMSEEEAWQNDPNGGRRKVTEQESEDVNET